MNALAESLLPRLRSILVSFADRILAANPTLTYDLGNTKNDAFLLRAYLSFRTHGDGDEVAVTVDVRADAGVLTVVSDICGDNGQVIAVGPTVTISWGGDQPVPGDALAAWLGKFDQFLSDAETVVVKVASALS